jgi:4-amino-4-deoxy-L-arabinose transferase-like glycosyltransferase
MMVVSGKIFGFNNFSAKLPSATLAFLSIIVMFLFVQKYYDYVTNQHSCA